ncbi:MAG: dihydroorotate dehydrogenase electron transfer subunit [Nitrospirae bacterium]|nr:dihydroorotate dehydrogenase electron transfer subunit [Nitrospirota bacterium]
MSRYFRAEIAENRPLGKDYGILTFAPSETAVEPEAGQFYMIGRCAGKNGVSLIPVSCRDLRDPLLKRPFSFFRKTRTGYQILYRIKGKWTAMMRDMKQGSSLHVLGPLGNSYPPLPKGHTPVIVGGGLGIASVFSLAEKFAGSAYIFYGTRTTEELVMLDELKGFAKRLLISTDDGSCGAKGCITDMIRNFGGEDPAGMYTLYACGPRAMMAALDSIAKERGMKGYVSLEENMACGIGACLGCVVKTVTGHQRVCKEGPVFDIGEVLW